MSCGDAARVVSFLRDAALVPHRHPDRKLDLIRNKRMFMQIDSVGGGITVTLRESAGTSSYGIEL